MILGIGTDIVEVARIQQKIETREDFKKMVFSEKEIAYCEKNAFPSESFSARFAAKEAFLKALETGLSINCDLKEIEILNESSGKPFVNLSQSLNDMVMKKFNRTDFVIHLSLSHTSQFAIAYLIIESKNVE